MTTHYWLTLQVILKINSDMHVSNYWTHSKCSIKFSTWTFLLSPFMKVSKNIQVMFHCKIELFQFNYSWDSSWYIVLNFSVKVHFYVKQFVRCWRNQGASRGLRRENEASINACKTVYTVGGGMEHGAEGKTVRREGGGGGWWARRGV